MATTSIADIKAGLSHLKDLEDELSQAKWQDTPSPKGVDDALLQRYVAARDLYLKRRMETLLVEHVKTFDPSSQTFDMPDANDDDETIEERHAQALLNLETTVQTIQAQVSQLRDGHRSIKSQREELERMLKDMEGADGSADDDMDEDDDADDAKEVSAQDLRLEQERIEELEKTKRQLEEELASLKQETAETQARAHHKQSDIVIMEQQVDETQDMRKKLEELREMKVFYDSLREVLEELGGVKIDAVKEDKANRHLHLTLVLYDSYKVAVELQVYRRHFLKLVDAKWASDPIVGDASFSLPLEPLDDLVQVAKTTLGPPHDLRFIVRESLALLRIQRDRLNDLSVLRENVLTKVVGGDQVVCSLNDGIVVVMRLYEHWVRVEQVVGVSGWDSETTEKIRAGLNVDERSTPSSIVEQVQQEVERLLKGGVVKPGTPKLPRRRDEIEQAE
eukprot:CAMPEP_0117070574 /NCGR_PEP_ID=MMETSP0472-20121206/49578_1 /TAXON_ID=693140 ORGANISM="Tiarina fusus, Strain LIS" /NCGR_SAMPLE_ID=MMETSP0472 /ASSEMBLY_ACC=CAM_ASM_000603 /LENGTH=449 /DNA_ID=CAMNT_0004793727 /DNA_START=37 /DNA_END=1386 /DNA_ORIENTATION=-